MEKVRARRDRAVDALKAAQIPFAVAGGNAVAAWIARVDEAAVRTTVDVEVILRLEDLEKGIVVLEKAGFRYVRGWAHFFFDSSSGNDKDRILVYIAGEKRVPMDLATVPDISEVDCSGPFPIVDLEPLVRMKLDFYGFTDRVDLLDMINVGLIDQSWMARYSGELAARLQSLLDDPDKFDNFT